MNKKLFSLLTCIFTVIIIFGIAKFSNIDLVKSLALFTNKTNTVNINGIDVVGDNTKYPVEFVKKVDGDTIRVKFNGKEYVVRYLNIDTPETVKQNHPVETYGPEASQLNENLLKNAKTVALEFDVNQKFDKYNRLLAYVWADDILVQEELLKNGLAEIKYVYEPDTRYIKRFTKAQNQAKAQKLNIWR